MLTKLLFFFSCLLLFIPQAFSALDTENSIIKQALINTPEILKQNSLLNDSQIAVRRHEDTFSTDLFFKITHKKTNEESFAPNQPIFNPHNFYEIGLKKTFQKGITSSISLFSDNRSFLLSGAKESKSKAFLGLSLELDLWKNFLGRLDAFEQAFLTAQLNQSTLNKKIQVKAFVLKIRSLYWGLLASLEAETILKDLLLISNKQLAYSAKKLTKSLVDKDETARLKAHVATTRRALLAVKIKKEGWLETLGRLTPQIEINQQSIQKDELNQILESAITCFNNIKTATTPPMNSTLYDELTKEIDVFYKNKSDFAATYASVDLKLTGEVFTSAIGPSGLPAFEEAFSENRQGYSLGLQLTIPLGRSETQAQTIKNEQLKSEYRRGELLQIMKATHLHFLRYIPIYLEALNSHHEIRKQLKIRNTELRKKYKQGRTTLATLLLDQDLYLQSELQLIDTKLQLLEAFKTYISIYTETECYFNRN